MSSRLRRANDVLDTPDDLAEVAAAPRLSEALQALNAEIGKPFAEADRRALQNQRSFRRITWWATTFGTISILLSIANLVATVLQRPDLASRLFLVQVVTLGVTTVAVLWGLLAFRHEHWLLERCRAEQLRALKFAHLVDAAIWSEDEKDREAWRARVRADVGLAQALRYEDIVAIAGREEVPGLAAAIPAETDSGALAVLADYYRRRRLAPQLEYFLQASREHGRLGARALPLFFFGAVFLEVIQAVLTVTYRSTGTGSLESVGYILSGAAIAIPAIWAGIRTQQGARESSRNATRSLARHHALTQLGDRLLKARGNPAELLWTMRLAEFVLQVDQREWLRLLREAEWYG